MSLQRVAVSIPLADSRVDPEAYVPVFHDWIRRAAVHGVLIDVARYGHVHHGPGIMLVGHEGDYSLDFAAGRHAIRYTLKRDNDGTPAELVSRALDRVRAAVALLVTELGVEPIDDEIDVQVFDRLTYPNTPDSLAVLDPMIREVVGGGESLELTRRSEDPRAPLAVAVRGAAPGCVH
jgi:hypothetical protein